MKFVRVTQANQMTKRKIRNAIFMVSYNMLKSFAQNYKITELKLNILKKLLEILKNLAMNRLTILIVCLKDIRDNKKIAQMKLKN